MLAGALLLQVIATVAGALCDGDAAIVQFATTVALTLTTPLAVAASHDPAPATAAATPTPSQKWAPLRVRLIRLFPVPFR
jgi:hypothetical protein